jgi:hypothetical protein
MECQSVAGTPIRCIGDPTDSPFVGCGLPKVWQNSGEQVSGPEFRVHPRGMGFESPFLKVLAGQADCGRQDFCFPEAVLRILVHFRLAHANAVPIEVELDIRVAGQQ